MTIEGEATKIEAEERMETTVDGAALEGGADFEAEVVSEEVSGVVEEAMAEDGKRNDNRKGGETESIFDQKSDVILLLYITQLLTPTIKFRGPINAVLCMAQGSTMFYRPTISTFTKDIFTPVPKA